jgi:hypothetical protein
MEKTDVRMYLTGNPIATAKDSAPIYTQHQYVPNGSQWTENIEVSPKEITAFLAHLHYVTLEQNGFCYYYPNIKHNVTVCRYEWHRNFRGKNHFLRIGFVIRVTKGEIVERTFYIGTSESFQNRTHKADNITLTEAEQDAILKTIRANIGLAQTRLRNTPDKSIGCIYYFDYLRPVSALIRIAEDVLLLPTYSTADVNAFAAILYTPGFSFTECNWRGNEKAGTFAALFTLSIGYLRVGERRNAPLYTEINADAEEEHLEKLATYYPEGKEGGIGGFQPLERKDFERLTRAYQAIEAITQSKQREKALNLVFAYFSGMDLKRINRTAAVVSFVACIAAAARDLEPPRSKEERERSVVLRCLARVFGKAENDKDLTRWWDRIHGKHRSSYVHAAIDRFDRSAHRKEETPPG